MLTDMKEVMVRQAKPSDRPRDRAAQTREMILRAMADGLSNGGLDELSVQSIARKAGVAPRTVYRHFSSRQMLFDAFVSWSLAQVDLNHYPQTPQELVKAPPRVFAMLDRVESAVRGYLASPAAREVGASIDASRFKATRRCVAAAAEGVSDEQIDRTVAIIMTLFSAAGWRALRDSQGLSGQQAGEAVAWAIQVLLRELLLRRGAGD